MKKKPVKLTEEQKSEILRSTETCIVLANRYGVSATFVKDLRRGMAKSDPSMRRKSVHSHVDAVTRHHAANSGMTAYEIGKRYGVTSATAYAWIERFKGKTIVVDGVTLHGGYVDNSRGYANYRAFTISEWVASRCGEAR